MNRNPTPFFAYLFFCFFAFNVLALSVSLFSSTFSQLFSLLSQDGRVSDMFLYFFYFLGFCICLRTLITTDWSKQDNSRFLILILGLNILFVFLFVFGWFGNQERISLLDLILLKEGSKAIGDLVLEHFGEMFVFGFFYVFFIFLPLTCELFHLSPNPHHFLGVILKRLKPSLNIVIYALIGASLQSYFHKGHWFFYLDLVALFCACVLFVLVVRRRNKLEFFEICNLSFFVTGIVIFAFSSKILHEANFNARYAIFVFTFVAWCGEWMLKLEENEPLVSENI